MFKIDLNRIEELLTKAGEIYYRCRVYFRDEVDYSEDESNKVVTIYKKNTDGEDEPILSLERLHLHYDFKTDILYGIFDLDSYSMPEDFEGFEATYKEMIKNEIPNKKKSYFPILKINAEIIEHEAKELAIRVFGLKNVDKDSCYDYGFLESGIEDGYSLVIRDKGVRFVLLKKVFTQYSEEHDSLFYFFKITEIGAESTEIIENIIYSFRKG